MARLKSGVTLDRAQAEIAAIAATLARDHPTTSTNTDLRVMPLSSLVSASVPGGR